MNDKAIATQSSTTARLEVLQIYRAVAALVVVLHHINAKFSAEHYYGAVIPDFFAWGQLGVDFFFVLSGFIIAMSLSKTKTASEFLKHRAVRVFPPFWLAFFTTLPVAVLAAASLHNPVTSDLLALFRAALLLPQEQPPVIGVAWTLHHEVLFYALAALWIRLPQLACTVAAVLLIGAVSVHDSFWARFLFSPFHWEFLAGIAAFRIRDRIPDAWIVTLVGVCAALLTAACAWFSLSNLFWHPGRFLLFAPLFAVLVAASSRIGQSPASHFSLLRRVGSRLGDSSYTLYLWHVPLVTPMTKAVFARLPPPPRADVAFVFVLTVAIACCAVVIAHLIYTHIEDPIVRKLRRFVDAR